jgi:hypothetical protein
MGHKVSNEINELKSFESKNVFSWVHIDKVSGEPILPIKIVYKKKLDADGNVKQFKTRITVQGQRESSEDLNTHAGTIYFSLILMLLCLAAMLNLDLIFCDVESAYLNAPTNRDVYALPTDFAYKYFNKSKEYVWKFNKALYGLKDSARLADARFILDDVISKHDNSESFYFNEKCGEDSELQRDKHFQSGCIKLLLGDDDNPLNDQERQAVHTLRMEEDDEVEEIFPADATLPTVPDPNLASRLDEFKKKKKRRRKES